MAQSSVMTTFFLDKCTHKNHQHLFFTFRKDFNIKLTDFIWQFYRNISSLMDVCCSADSCCVTWCLYLRSDFTAWWELPFRAAHMWPTEPRVMSVPGLNRLWAALLCLLFIRSVSLLFGVPAFYQLWICLTSAWDETWEGCKLSLSSSAKSTWKILTWGCLSSWLKPGLYQKQHLEDVYSLFVPMWP